MPENPARNECNDDLSTHTHLPTEGHVIGHVIWLCSSWSGVPEARYSNGDHRVNLGSFRGRRCWFPQVVQLFRFNDTFDTVVNKVEFVCLWRGLPPDVL